MAVCAWAVLGEDRREAAERRRRIHSHFPGGPSVATHTKDRMLQFRGQNLVDSDGSKIGSIEEIYLDAETNEPEWALVNTGLFGTKSTFVPLRDASDDGETLRVPYEKAKVKDAPKMDPDGQLSQ